MCILNKSTRSRNDITDITADHYGDVYFLQWVKSYYKELYTKIIQMHQCKFSTPPQLILISWFLVKGKKLKHKNDTSPLFDIIIYLDLAGGILQLVTQPV